MSSSTVKKCDVCGKEEKEPKAGSAWAHLSLSTGWYGPHPYFTGPHASQHDSASRSDDVCSAECAIKWLRKRIERIEANLKGWAEWNAKEPEREAARRRLDEENRRREQDRAEDQRRQDEERRRKIEVPELPDLDRR